MDINEKQAILTECLHSAELISKKEKFLSTYECWVLAIQLQNVIETKTLVNTLLFLNKDKEFTNF